MHRSGGDFVVCCERNERVDLQFRCKMSLPADSVRTSRPMRCGEIRFCKMMPHLAIRLVAAMHFVLGARVWKDAFFVSQLRCWHKKILTPIEFAEEVTALHAAAQRQLRWLHKNCCMDSSSSTSLVQWHATWAAPQWHGTSWTGCWNAVEAHQWRAGAEWHVSACPTTPDTRTVQPDVVTRANYKRRRHGQTSSLRTDSSEAAEWVWQ